MRKDLKEEGYITGRVAGDRISRALWKAGGPCLTHEALLRREMFKILRIDKTTVRTGHDRGTKYYFKPEVVNSLIEDTIQLTNGAPKETE